MKIYIVYMGSNSYGSYFETNIKGFVNEEKAKDLIRKLNEEKESIANCITTFDQKYGADLHTEIEWLQNKNKFKQELDNFILLTKEREEISTSKIHGYHVGENTEYNITELEVQE